MAYYIPGQHQTFCKYDSMSPTTSIHYLDVQGMQAEWNAVSCLHCRLMGIGWLGLLFARQRIPSNVQFRFLFTRPKIAICHSWLWLLDSPSLTAQSLDEHPQYFMTQFNDDLKYFKNAVTTDLYESGVVKLLVRLLFVIFKIVQNCWKFTKTWWGSHLRLWGIITIPRIWFRWIFGQSLRWLNHPVGVSAWWLTHWGRVTHICVGKLAMIGSDNGLSPARRQAIIWTNAGILLIGPLGTNSS